MSGKYIFQPITDWHDRFGQISCDSPTALIHDSSTASAVRVEEVLAAYCRDEKVLKIFKIQIPRDETTAQSLQAEKYIKTYIYNRAWAMGPDGILINCSQRYWNRIHAAFMEESGEYHHLTSFMTTAYRKPFLIQRMSRKSIEHTTSAIIEGGYLSIKKGARIGVDLGGTDIKAVALIDGELKWYRKMNWNPKAFTDAEQHLSIVERMIREAQKESELQSLDGIGVSTAGVVVNGRIMISGLGAGLTKEQFEEKVTPMGEIISERFSKAPVNVAHDGDVAALWAHDRMGLSNVLGLALGTGLGAGYTDREGHIIGYLCEIGKSILDMHPEAPEHIYYHTRGPALHYLSQNAVFRLAKENNINIEKISEPAEKLKEVQRLAETGDKIAEKIFEQIGRYLATAVVEFYDYFEMESVVLFGRVISGQAGEIILNSARHTLAESFPQIATKVQLYLPVANRAADKRTEEDAHISREFGQAIAAASLSRVS